MYNYIKGQVISIDGNVLVLENNQIGYEINMANPFVFNVNEDATIYLYQNIKEDDNSLFGFKTVEEKNMFLKLINVKGIGPKMALPILATGNINALIDAIERENVLYLKKFPKIGDKVARQIILDLKGKLAHDTQDNISVESDELVSILLGLGYKQADVKKILPNINHSLSIEEQVKQALKCMLK